MSYLGRNALPQCLRLINDVTDDLADLESSVEGLEKQWERLRDDPGRVSPIPEAQTKYLKRLHRWYTIEMPRDKATLQKRVNEYWAEGLGLEWLHLSVQLLPSLDECGLQILKPQIGACNLLWAKLPPRCFAACEKWDELVQLEVPGNVHLYFASIPLERLQGPQDVDRYSRLGR